LTSIKTGDNYESLAGFWLCNNKFGVINMILAVLESLEAKELFVFSGSGVGKYEDVVAKTDPHAEVSEHSGAVKDGGWLRKGYCLLEKQERGGVDRVPGTEGTTS
jgi:hypothetical protein